MAARRRGDSSRSCATGMMFVVGVVMLTVVVLTVGVVTDDGGESGVDTKVRDQTQDAVT